MLVVRGCADLFWKANNWKKISLFLPSVSTVQSVLRKPEPNSLMFYSRTVQFQGRHVPKSHKNTVIFTHAKLFCWVLIKGPPCFLSTHWNCLTQVEEETHEVKLPLCWLRTWVTCQPDGLSNPWLLPKAYFSGRDTSLLLWSTAQLS